LQVFRQIHVYDKDEKSFEQRKHKLQWNDIASSSGYVHDGILFLPAPVANDKKFTNCDLITIEDEADVTAQHEYKMIHKHYEKGNNHCFNLHHHNEYEIFSFYQTDPLQLHLKYSYSAIGDPARDNFLLTTIENNIPVEIKINGKIDSTNGRHYKEQSFIFLLLGDFNNCCILEENALPIKKHIPRDRKVVNLIKPLW
jgi:hypothetical protein